MNKRNLSKVFVLVCVFTVNFVYISYSNASPSSEVLISNTPLDQTSKQQDYIKKTKNKVYEKDSREAKSSETDSKPLHHAKVDSALILDRYENKEFIKEKIQHIAAKVVQQKKKDPSIADQIGVIGQKRVSISVDQNVNVKDAILEVSHLAGINVEVDPEIEGSIIIALKNEKIADVLERIAQLAHLTVSVRDDVVRFTANKPFTKNYSIAFIDSNGFNNRMTNGVIGIGSNQASHNNIGGVYSGNANSNIFHNNDNFNNGNANTGNSLINAGTWQNNNSMWEEFEKGLKYIVSQSKGTEYSINRQAGLVTLRAPLAIHDEVAQYVEKIKQLATTQILVEVRLVEVSLEDEFSAGIDFSYLSQNFGVTNTFIGATASSAAGSPFVAKLNPFKSSTSKGLKGSVQFLQTFGTTKTISSPRLSVMNNQRAQLSFAQDYVYFQLQPQIQNQYTTVGVTPTNPNTPIVVQSQMRTIPIGVILNLQATADIEAQEITMNIHPVISSLAGTREDPAASFLSNLQISGASQTASIVNTVPIVEKKELNSTLRIKSGDIMVIGGFTEERTKIVRKGIPWFKDLPLLRYAFGSDQQYAQNVETVIFIKASIVDTNDSLSNEDVTFYNDFA